MIEKKEMGIEKVSILLGEKLKNARKQMGMSQNEVAEKLMLSRQTISKWENNICLPDLENFQRICKLYEVDSSSFLENNEEIIILDNKTTEEKKQEYQKIYYLIPFFFIKLILEKRRIKKKEIVLIIGNIIISLLVVYFIYQEIPKYTTSKVYF